MSEEPLSEAQWIDLLQFNGEIYRKIQALFKAHAADSARLEYLKNRCIEEWTNTDGQIVFNGLHFKLGWQDGRREDLIEGVDRAMEESHE